MTPPRSQKVRKHSITAFPDTNIFLHFRAFEKIDWPEELGADNVHLKIAGVVSWELTKHRESHPVEHIRDRARKTLRAVREIAIDGEGTIESSVTLSCETQLVGYDMAAIGLDAHSQDDCILAAILDYRAKHPEEQVVLITDDDPFAVRAHTYGVASRALREELRIPPQPDKRQKQIQDLKQQLREAKTNLPRLSIGFPSGGATCEIPLKPDVVVTNEDAQRWVAAQIAPLHPAKSVESWRGLAKQAKTRSEMLELSAPFLEALASTGEFMATQANTARVRYFAQSAEYYLLAWKHANDTGRTQELRLVVSNTGTVPAEDLNIFFRIPKVVSVFADDALPPPPTPPTAPGQKPTPTTKKTASMSPRPICFVRWTDVGDHWEFHYVLPRLNHHLTETLTGLHVRFPSYEMASAFTIEYRLAAVNAPDAATGKLHVVPVKAEAQPKRIAKRSRR
jgi:hypothetical protein